MSNVEGIFYKAIKFGELSQLGGKELEESDVETEDYTDGLSVFEMKKIDKNSDGVVTKDEFSALNLEDIDNKWQEYFGDFQENDIDFSNDKAGRTTKFTAKGEDIKNAKFDKDDDNKLTSYEIDAKTSLGNDVLVQRTVKDGEITDTKTTLKDTASSKKEESETSIPTTTKNKAAGSAKAKSKLPAKRTKEKDGSTKITGDKTSAAGESTVKLNKEGKITEVKNKIGDFNISGMKYDSKGKLNKIKIGDKEYNSKSIKFKKNGTAIITKSDGSKLKISAPNKEGAIKISNITKKNKLSSSIELNKNYEPASVLKYNSKGVSESRYFANDSKIREYKRTNNKLTSSEDYKCENGSKTGSKLSEQKYTYNKTLKRYLWSERTLYDGKTNKKTGSRKYKYETNKDTVKFTKTYYDANGKNYGTLTSSEGKTTPKIHTGKKTTDANGNTTEISFDSSGIRSKKVVTQKDGTVITYKWVPSTVEGAGALDGKWEKVNNKSK